MQRRTFVKRVGVGVAALALPSRARAAARPAGRPPNILWLCAEDMSPNMSCYGETAIRTPNIDRLASHGARFTHAFITAPVCSPSRSAMVTGMYQTSTGTHNHRSSRDQIKLRLPEHVKLVPQVFQQAGYWTSNGARPGPQPTRALRPGKTDYNFVWAPGVYDGADWSGRKADQPFFAQIQLSGGKNRGAKVPEPVDPAEVTLPPYYPDHPVLRQDWARYLNSVIQTDREVGWILDRLETEGLLDHTVIFFWTDHGISHVRDKQFLYEGGIHIPLIVRGPGIAAGKVRDDLVEHIDIPATSLALAGLPVPAHLQGRPLFSPDYQPRDSVFAARDRCDETVERIRSVRTRRYKYIRNFWPERPHAQHNRYKNHKPIMITMRRLYAEGKLNADQGRVFLPARPTEELYDLDTDPNELRNLAASPDHEETLKAMRGRLVAWIDATRDLGEIPEPAIAEFLLDGCDTPWAILEDEKNLAMVKRLREVQRLGEAGKGSAGALAEAMRDPAPAVRHEAARWLGNLGAEAKPAADALTAALADVSPSVRSSAARAVCKLGMPEKGLPVLVRQLKEGNEVVRHYAALALEDIGEMARPALDDLKAAREDRYELVWRVADRTVCLLEGIYDPTRTPESRPRPKRKPS